MKKVTKLKTPVPSMEEAKDAVRTLIAWAGDDPDREGLIETPDRVARAYQEFFAGYHDDPEEILSKTFEEVEGYDEMVLIKNIRLESHCEHHIVPILGIAHVAYMPNKRVVGISKLARLVDVYAKRLQIQETLITESNGSSPNIITLEGKDSNNASYQSTITINNVAEPAFYINFGTPVPTGKPVNVLHNFDK